MPTIWRVGREWRRVPPLDGRPRSVARRSTNVIHSLSLLLSVVKKSRETKIVKQSIELQ